MSMEAYETLYCSSAAFGIRKALQSQEGKEQLYRKVLDLQVRFTITTTSSRLAELIVMCRMNVTQ